MDKPQFECMLITVSSELKADLESNGCSNEKEFERLARGKIAHHAREYANVPLEPIPQAFPDIEVGDYGVEVKFTKKDTWRCVANSIQESTRLRDFSDMYVLYGKLGGTADVRWGDYGNVVCHVRTTHLPRFEVDLDNGASLFKQLGMDYKRFAALDIQEKMEHVRRYARNRLKEGEGLWWLEPSPEGHTVDVNISFYTKLPLEKKLQLTAECALLCPEIFGGSRERDKYSKVALFLITYRNVLAYNTRDLFTAGSAAERFADKRFKSHILNAIAGLSPHIIDASVYLDDALFAEYWGYTPKRSERLIEWLALADQYAPDGEEPSRILASLFS